MSNITRIMSGIQPTGNLHLGRFFGAVQNWVSLQEKYRCFYSVVNYHAMTMPYDPVKLRQMSWDVAINLLACGVNLENIFIQSFVPEHTELAWILGCSSSYGELSRMTQFKDKSQQVKSLQKDSHISTGLFTYPVLQAADILVYKADGVPVGKDQEQHLELTRNIANRFNQQVKNEYFSPPQPIYTQFPKIMSTANPEIKMSASKGEKHNIDLFEEPARMRKQIMSAVTDSGQDRSLPPSQGIENLLSLVKACDQQEIHSELVEGYKNGALQYGALKTKVADVVVDFCGPYRERKAELVADKKNVKNAIKSSSFEIRKVAQETLKEVKALAGI